MKRIITEFTLFSCYALISLFGLNGLRWLRDEDSFEILGWIIVGICIICMCLQLSIDVFGNLDDKKVFIETLWLKLSRKKKT